VSLRSLALPRFWDLYDRLPVEIQAQADKDFDGNPLMNDGSPEDIAFVVTMT
jgi:hypothetical protein